MKRVTMIRMAAVAAVAVSGLFATSSASADGVSVGIRIGEPAPAPVVVRETTVYSYDTYVVGPRRYLYDADWRLRLAQADEIRAERDLDAARRHEGEVAVALDDQEALVADLHRRVDGAAANADELRVRLGALEKRVASAREDLDAARVLRDGPGIADAEKRLHDNEAAAAATAENLRRAQDGAASRDRLRAAEADLDHIRADLDAAHDAVYAAQDRLTLSHEAMCVALHDRDEALWGIYRDDLVAQRIRPEDCGFSLDLNFFGGHYPRDPEVLHTYFVRDVGYWRARPVEVYNRVVVVDRVTEITRIREVERVHEVKRIKEVETVESSVPAEQRRAYAERVKVEHDRFEAEKVERTNAAASGQKYHVTPTERAEAKATVIKARADAKSEVAGSRADAKATRLTAAADAKATREQSAAEARATDIKARADARTEVREGRADAKATRETAHADARATEIQAHGDRKSEVIDAHSDAKAKVAEARADKIEARGDAKAKVAEAHADKVEAKGDAKAKVAEAHGDAKAEEIHARTDARGQAHPEDRKVADRTTEKPATAARNDPSSDRNTHKPAVGDGHDVQTAHDRSNRDGNGNGNGGNGNGRNNKGNKGDRNPNDPQYSGR
jgi:hypothetical protein